MTSNQIANRTNIESERHNVVVEAETERHNRASEQIQAQANEENRQYHERMNDIQDRYNDALLAYYNASLDHKKEYEDALAAIGKERNDLESAHNQAMESLGNRQADIDEAYKTAVAWKGLYDSSLEAKRVYYEEQKTEAYISSIANMHIENMQRIQNEAKKIQHERTMDTINQSRLDRQVKVLEEQLQFTQRKWDEAEKLGVKSRAYRDIIESVATTAKTTMESLKTLSQSMAGAEALAAVVSGL